jgi:hypothetical protein
VFSFISRLGSAKGMVKAPSVSSLSDSNARAAIANSGLVVSPSSAIINTNIALQGGVILSQAPPAETLVDYETPMIINLGNFVADTVTPGPCIAYSTTTAPNYCNGQILVYGSTTTKRKSVISTRNNVTQEISTVDNFAICTDVVVDNGSAYVDGQCGYVIPPVSCTPTITYGSYGTCNAANAYLSSGTKTRTISGTDSKCNPFSYPDYASCCQNICTDWSEWDTLPSDTNKERRAQNCQYTNCFREQVVQVRCKTTTTTTYGGCGSKGTRVKTVKTYVCGIWQSTATSTINCQIKL